MLTKEMMEQELDGMRKARQEQQARLVQLQAEVEQLAGAIAFGEYLLDQLNGQETPAEEEK